MKHLRKVLLGSLLLIGLHFSWIGCVGPGEGGVSYGGGVVYGDGPWFQDDLWLDGGGRGWYGNNRGGAYVHPGGGNHGGGRPAGGASRPAGGNNRGGDHR
jgi:hypothetical protein